MMLAQWDYHAHTPFIDHFTDATLILFLQSFEIEPLEVNGSGFFLQTRCRCCYTVSSVRAVKESQSKPVAWPHRFFIYHRTVDKPVACSGQIKKKAVGGRDRERGRVWGGGIPLPIAGRVCGGGRASSPENFWSILCERMHFGAPFIEEYR